MYIDHSLFNGVEPSIYQIPTLPPSLPQSTPTSTHRISICKQQRVDELVLQEFIPIGIQRAVGGDALMISMHYLRLQVLKQFVPGEA
jgi:hypothetical protein